MIHIDIGKRRFSGNEELYEKHLRRFLSDAHYAAIAGALGKGSFAKAAGYARRLKLKSYNLGMIRLAKACDALCIAIQQGKGEPDFQEEMREVAIVYDMMKECIQKAFSEQG
jgi:nitroreductase